MDQSLLQRIVVPVANRKDAAATAAALASQVEGMDCAVIAVHVIERNPGTVDKASPEHRKQNAAEIFRVVETALKETGISVESDLRYGRDIAGSVIEAAHENNATGIVFTPRGASRWEKLLTGDVTHKLVENSDIPVVVLPDNEDG
ncbi:universal stress protein [Halovenus sp. HT40]|uniref:universal stress protein n=1 Tax=Halovenus sp. HT40 TaxID=3126691 RepID=UPI00300F47C3